MEERKGKLKMIFIFLRYFLVILLVPLLITGVLYSQMVHLIEENTYESQLASLVKGGEDISRSLVDLESMSHSIGMNPFIQAYIISENPIEKGGGSLQAFSNARNYLSTFSLIAKPFDSILLYSQRSNSMLRDQIIDLRLEENYSKTFYVDTMSFVEMGRDFLQKNYHNEFLYNVTIRNHRTEQEYIVFANSMPNSSKNNYANIFLLVNPSTLLKPIQSATEYEYQWQFIFSKEVGVAFSSLAPSRETSLELIAQMPQQSGKFIETVNGEKVLVSYYKNTNKDTIYVSGVSHQEIMRPTQPLRRVFFVLLLTAILTGLFVALGLSYTSSKSALKLFSLLGLEEEETKLSFRFINTQVAKIVQNNRGLRVQIEEQLPAQKIAILYRLLNSSAHWTPEFEEKLSEIGFNRKAKAFCVLMVVINEMENMYAFDEASAYKVLLNEKIEQFPIDIFGVFHSDVDREAILLQSSQEDYVDFLDDIERFTTQLHQEMIQQHGVSISFSGSITKQPEQIKKTYHEAVEALSYQKPMNALHVMWYKKYRNIQLAFHYPIEQEVALIHAVKHGEDRECSGILHEMHKVNFIRNKQPSSSQKLLLEALVSTVLRFDHLSVEQQKFMLHYIDSLDSETMNMEQEFIKTSEWIIDESRRRSSSENDEGINLVERALLILQANYTDSQVSLVSVASELEISESYLSRLLKEKTTENFSKHLETFRMERAFVLLQEKQLTVQQVAESVGYNSAQVFRRAYKRYYGYSPSQHIEK